MTEPAFDQSGGSRSPTAETAAAIAIRDLHFAWRPGQPPLLDLPELTVNRGERLFVRGPSGSGKTTLLNLIGGVLQPQSGKIAVLGQPLAALNAARRDRYRADHMGIIFQMFNLLPYLSVLENVLLPCRFSRRRAQAVSASGSPPGEEARRLLARLDIRDADLHRRAADLSVGQQQRVAAARALIGHPQLLIADEPTSALDAERRSRFVQLLLDECHTRSTSLVFVSHDASLESHFERSLDLARINRAAGRTD